MANVIRQWLVLFTCILFTFQSAQAERRILEKPKFDLEKKADTFGIESDPRTGNFLIRYIDENEPITVVFTPATKIDVIVTAEVEVHDAFTYTYKYKIVSLKSSVQRVHSLIIDYSDAILSVVSPEGWSTGPLSFRAALDWTDIKPKRFGLPPDASQSGFSFKALALSSAERFVESHTSAPGVFYQHGSLPGLVRCYARGYVEILKFPKEAPEGLIDNIPKYLDDAVIGKTVGPVRLPTQFQSHEFLQNIKLYNYESLAQGWITEPQIANENEKRLKEIENSLATGDRAATRGLLTSFAMAIETEAAQKKITSEAYALLKYNVQYLEQRL